MPGRKKPTSRVLTCIIILICLISGLLLSQSSASYAPLNPEVLPDIIIAEETQEGSLPQDYRKEQVTPSPTEEPSEEEIKEQESREETAYSPEAELGTWVASGSDWTFLVKEKPVTGWFTDTDMHRYYLDKDGIMQTGWLTYDGEKYYLNEDGIMQTGTVEIQGKSYTFSEDGILQKETRTTPAPTVSEEDETDSDSASAPVSSPSQLKKASKGAQIALTFDDGPGMYTERLLNVLEAYDAKATFFLVGTNIQSYPETVRRMKELGCEFGNHTNSHVDLTTLSTQEIQEQLNDMEEILRDTVGESPSLIRPPFGAINDTVEEAAGSPFILWSLDAAKEENPDIATILETIYSQAEDGDIIHLHDIHESTVAAAEIFIPELVDKGYELVTVSELAEAKGIKLQVGNTYDSMKK